MVGNSRWQPWNCTASPQERPPKTQTPEAKRDQQVNCQKWGSGESAAGTEGWRSVGNTKEMAAGPGCWERIRRASSQNWAVGVHGLPTSRWRCCDSPSLGSGRSDGISAPTDLAKECVWKASREISTQMLICVFRVFCCGLEQASLSALA